MSLEEQNRPNDQINSIEACAASYRAQQVPGAVIIFAEGVHPTSGYKEFFQRSMIDVFPPQFSLWHVVPSGIVLQVITPFTEHTSFSASHKVDEVTVHDADGKHVVPVEQVPDVLVKHK